MSEPARVLFCGDRAVAIDLITHIADNEGEIVGLGVNVAPFAEAAASLEVAARVNPQVVFHGRSFGSDIAVRRFRAAAPDLGVCCGFAYVLPPELLAVPRWGWVNIHRSYLPYNRGLDPLQWALVEGTPAGVTLHVMTEEVDAGPVVAQAEFPIVPTDSFQTLSDKADRLALDLFASQWPKLRAGVIDSTPQDHDVATYHSWADCQRLRKLDLKAEMSVGRLLDILRGYTGHGVSGVSFQLGPLRFSVHTEVKPQIDVRPGTLTSAAARISAAGHAPVVPATPGAPAPSEVGHSNNHAPLEVNR